MSESLEPKLSIVTLMTDFSLRRQILDVETDYCFKVPFWVSSLWCVWDLKLLGLLPVMWRQTDDAGLVWGGSVQSVQPLSHVQLFAAPWTAAHQASLSISISQSLLKLMPIESVMPSNHLLLLSPSPPAFNLSQHQSLFQ